MDSNENENEKLLNKITNVTCKVIIAELESIREEMHIFIDNLIDEQIKQMKEE